MTEETKNSSRWRKGTTGNPAGRPRKDQVDDLDELKKIEKMLRKATPEAVKLLIKNMQQATTAESQSKAATLVIDKFIVFSKELDRKEDRKAGVSPSVPSDDEKPKVTRVSFTLNQPKEADAG